MDNSEKVIVKLVKLSDDKFNGNHPNGINKGFEIEGVMNFGLYDFPKVGVCFEVGSFHTSTVTEIVSIEKSTIIFKTLNSTYKVVYENYKKS